MLLLGFQEKAEEKEKLEEREIKKEKLAKKEGVKKEGATGSGQSSWCDPRKVTG